MIMEFILTCRIGLEKRNICHDNGKHLRNTGLRTGPIYCLYLLDATLLAGSATSTTSTAAGQSTSWPCRLSTRSTSSPSTRRRRRVAARSPLCNCWPSSPSTRRRMRRVAARSPLCNCWPSSTCFSSIFQENIAHSFGKFQKLVSVGLSCKNKWLIELSRKKILKANRFHVVLLLVGTEMKTASATFGAPGQKSLKLLLCYSCLWIIIKHVWFMVGNKDDFTLLKKIFYKKF